jgi:hypothetical protein
MAVGFPREIIEVMGGGAGGDMFHVEHEISRWVK